MISGSMGFAGGLRLGAIGNARFLARLALCLWATLMMASRAQAMQLSPLQKQDMKQHYEKATRAYDVQKYNEAVEEYQKAYEIGGDPAMLYNVAQSYRLADQLPEALRFYRRYLQRSPNARNREDVERKIADLEKTVEERRKAALAAATPAPAPPPVVVAPAPAPAARTEEGGSGLRITGIVFTAVGAAGLITAAITGKLAGDKGDQLTSDSKRGDAVFDPAVERNGKSLNTVAIVSAIAGGAAVITGAVLIILSQASGSSETERGTQAALSPVIGGGVVGASAMMRF